MLSFKHVILIWLLISMPSYSAKKINIEIGKELTIQNLNQLSEKYSFDLIQKIKLPNGELRYKFFQYYESLLVWNTSIVTSVPDIKEIKEHELFSANFYTHIEDDIINIYPRISEGQAIHIATSHQTPHVGKIIKAHARLMVMIDHAIFSLYRANLIYHVDYFIDSDAPHRTYVVIDANTGKILDSWETLLC